MRNLILAWTLLATTGSYFIIHRKVKGDSN